MASAKKRHAAAKKRNEELKFRLDEFKRRDDLSERTKKETLERMDVLIGDKKLGVSKNVFNVRNNNDILAFLKNVQGAETSDIEKARIRIEEHQKLRLERPGRGQTILTNKAKAKKDIPSIDPSASGSTLLTGGSR